MSHISCPLCAGKKFTNSWLEVSFEEVVFKYLECADCRSLICSPMPDENMLSKMYGSTYFDFEQEAGEDNSLEKFRDVFVFLKTIEKGVFIDYGCGEGKLLKEVAKTGWDVLGIDFNPELATALTGTDIQVVNPSTPISKKADVLHLGDVLEHLTDLDAQMPEILDLLKSDGYLIAHGPLEGNANFFNWFLKLNKSIKRTKTTYMPPYHVILATSRGQRALFTRFDLRETMFQVQEVAFPAPETFSFKYLSQPRTAGLFFVRKLSQTLSSFNMQNSGNRYFYVGKKS